MSVVVILPSVAAVLLSIVILVISRGPVGAAVGCSHVVVLSFDCGIGEDLVGFIDLLEEILFAFVGIGMVLLGESPECLFDLVL